MDLLYYPGCTLKTSARNLERSVLAVAEALGYELKEMEDWNCCGVVSSLTDDDLMHHLAPLRTLVHVEDQGKDQVITPCDMCYNTLKQTAIRVQERPDDLEKLNSFMDLEEDYRQTVRVRHFLELLRDEVGFTTLKTKVKHALDGLRLMPYYGCMLLRPKAVAIDDPEDPTILSDLIQALGAEAIDNPYKVECCGSYHTIQQKELTQKRAHLITDFAGKRGADGIVLSCPLCRFNLDVRGKESEALFEGYLQLPVFYYSQLIAVALGLDPDCCGFEDHAVDPRRLLKEKRIL